MSEKLSLVRSLECHEIPLSHISEITGISRRRLEKYRRAHQQGRELPSVDYLMYKRPQLTEEQMGYILSKERLFQQGTLGLIGRVENFHRTFPDSKLSVKALRNIYRASGIKQRVLRVDYALT